MVTQQIANDAATDIFAELDAKSIALLLDVDGTLIDIAPSPNEVHVADDLRDSLARLSRLTGGALALVGGRPRGISRRGDGSAAGQGGARSEAAERQQGRRRARIDAPFAVRRTHAGVHRRRCHR